MEAAKEYFSRVPLLRFYTSSNVVLIPKVKKDPTSLINLDPSICAQSYTKFFLRSLLAD